MHSHILCERHIGYKRTEIFFSMSTAETKCQLDHVHDNQCLPTFVEVLPANACARSIDFAGASAPVSTNKPVGGFFGPVNEGRTDRNPSVDDTHNAQFTVGKTDKLLVDKFKAAKCKYCGK